MKVLTDIYLLTYQKKLINVNHQPHEQMKTPTIEINMEDLTEAGKLLLLGISAKLKCSPQEAMSSAVNSSGHLLFNRNLLTSGNSRPSLKSKKIQPKKPAA